MADTPAPEAVQIAADALRGLDQYRDGREYRAGLMLAALDECGWLYDPREVERLRAVADPIETAAEAAMGEVEELRAQLAAARAHVAELERLRRASVGLLDVVEAERDEVLCSDREVTARGELHAALGALLPAGPQLAGETEGEARLAIISHE